MGQRPSGTSYPDILLLSLCCALALAVAAAAYWLFSYSGDLPNMASVAQFAPEAETQATDPCSITTSIAIPYSLVGDNLHAALSATEASESGPGVLADFNEPINRDRIPRTVPMSLQIARRMVCLPSRPLNHETKEFRLRFGWSATIHDSSCSRSMLTGSI
jgi:hypothetical protein